jgi:hypothetical protein
MEIVKGRTLPYLRTTTAQVDQYSVSTIPPQVMQLSVYTVNVGGMSAVFQSASKTKRLPDDMTGVLNQLDQTIMSWLDPSIANKSVRHLLSTPPKLCF